MLGIVFPDAENSVVHRQAAEAARALVRCHSNDGKIAREAVVFFHWSTDRVGEPGYP